MQKKKKSKKKIIIGASVAVAAVLVVTMVFVPMLQSSQAASEMPTNIMQTATVERGTIETTVVGSGSLETTGTVVVEIPSGLSMDSVLVEAGDKVEAGDTLAVINVASLDSMIAQVQDALDDIDVDIAEAQEDTDNATIDATVGGRVKEIFVGAGENIKDVITANGATMIISVDGKMKVEFESSAALVADDDVTVVLPDGEEEDGVVASISGGIVTVTLTDNGPEVGDSVTILDEEDRTIGTGTLVINSPLEILSGSGTVESVDVDENEAIDAGDTLITLTETVASRGYASLISERNEYATTLRLLLDYAETGQIVAETGGVIGTVNVSSNSTGNTDSGTDTSASSATGYQPMNANSGESTLEVVTLENMGGEGELILLSDEAAQPAADGQGTTPDQQSGQATVTEIGGVVEIYINNPVTDNTPQSTIMPGAGYTGMVVWTPEAMQFEQETTYAATVTLTAGEGYAFAADAAAGVKGATVDAAGLVNTGATLTFNAVFQPTAAASQSANNMQSQNQSSSQSALQSAASASSGAAISSGGASSASSAVAAATDTASDSSVSDSIAMQTAFEITTGEVVTFTASVDELDILTLEEGQSATVVLDALPDEVLSGTVTHISETGTSQSGVTTYPVTIQLEIPEGVSIKAGMNASGTIVTGASENTLTIPVAALQEAGGEKFVMIQSDGDSDASETEQTEANSVISGERRVVETGISDGDRVEILSGLEEGETITYVEIVSTDSDDASAFMMGGNMSFGGGGEMPGGGMTFSGEMPSGGGMGGPPQQ